MNKLKEKSNQFWCSKGHTHILALTAVWPAILIACACVCLPYGSDVRSQVSQSPHMCSPSEGFQNIQSVVLSKCVTTQRKLRVKYFSERSEAINYMHHHDLKHTHGGG